MAFSPLSPDSEQILIEKARSAGLKAVCKILPFAQLTTLICNFGILLIFPNVQIRLSMYLCVGLITITAFFWSVSAILDYCNDKLLGKMCIVKHMVLTGLSAGFCGLLAFIIYPYAEGLQLVFLGSYIVGFITSGAFILATAPYLSMIWVGVLGSIITATLAGEHNFLFLVFTVLLLIFYGLILLSANSISRLFQKQFVSEAKMKEKEEALKCALHAAEEATAAKSQFLANMSHEIRTPMNGIIGYIDILSAMPLEKEQASYLAEVKTSTDALLLVINDILDYSKIEAGQMMAESISFNLHKLVEETVSLFSPKAHGKGIEILSYISAEVPVGVRGDLGRLRQVLNNLIGNAVKFTDQGEVAVRVRLMKENIEKVIILLEIQDTGIGISKEAKQRLFQTFMQADASTTRKYEGTGLGLAISKKILELMGGTIEVISEPEKGSSFSITLELEKMQLEEEEPRLRYDNLSNLRVMIVEDNDSNRMIICEYLLETGCEIISAKDGIEGIEILQGLAIESLPQIILVDYTMPRMNGHEFGQHLLTEERFKDIRFILITSAAQKGDWKLAQGIRFAGYLSKPVRRKELLEVVSEVFVLGVSEIKGNLTTRQTAPKKHPDLSNGYILLVEDMVPNQRLELIMLEKLGYLVDLAINGQQAVELCNAKKFNLILMDCQMPVMDGYEATEQIKKMDSLNKNTPVIAMTAHAMKGDREKCLAAGMDDYISKPISMVVLEATLAKYMVK
ncbi:response regulator [Desulfosporosinus hippei]|uniref:Circadian input-output histidine kinase CikA n=1 Tax=Desulfosporosinus hippei DSM 8344 TaxID=1121419 RepID=A0A1G7V717_9FIRM|nr:response regulator [Desulfosporosinus hippei]SDG55553.1 Signal transduction histidine kinase [Desulfosporosinus hippei DSM 8344]